MDGSDRCSSCAAGLPPRSHDRTCLRCGWDNQVQDRKCLKCKVPVSLHEGLGYGPIGGGIGLGGLIVITLRGGLFIAALIFAVAALCAFFSLLVLGYKCGTCGKRPEGRFLSSEERVHLRSRRLGYLIGTIVMAVGAIVFFYVSIGRFLL